MKLRQIIAAMLASACAVVSAQEPAGGQAPAEIVKMPLPCGQSMEFAMVRVQQNGESGLSHFASQKFDIGRSLDGDINERKAPTSVSGTVFVMQGKTNGYWVLPMGRTEVTRAQYASLMSPDTMPAAAEANLPMTNLSQLQMLEFVEKLNLWLFKNQKMPEVKSLYAKLCQSYMHGIPYLRLPTETEWEYVARGAAHVSPERLNNRHPYADAEEFMTSENLSTQKASAMREVAASGRANPCGVYDMLGNAEEMVMGVFRPEYYFGRVGGLVVRGASFAETYDAAASYKRRECPLFSWKDMAAYRNPLVGFRLVFGSEVMARRVKVEPLVKSWKEYWENSAQLNRRPQEVSTDSLTRQLHQQRADMERDIQRMKNLQQRQAEEALSQQEKFKTVSDQLAKMEAQLREKNKKSQDNVELVKMKKLVKQQTDEALAHKQQYDDMSSRLSEMEAKMRDMDKRVANAHQRMARSGVLIIDCFSYTAMQSMARIRANQEGIRALPASSPLQKKFRENIEKLEESVIFDWQKVCEGYETLVVADAQAIESQINERRNALRAHPEQLKTFDVAVKNFRAFQTKNGTLSEDSRRVWQQELDALAAASAKSK